MRRDTGALVKAAFATVLGILSVPIMGSPRRKGRGQRRWTSPFRLTTLIRRCLALSRLLFSLPICSRRYYGFDAKFRPSSGAISQSGKH